MQRRERRDKGERGTGGIHTSPLVSSSTAPGASKILIGWNRPPEERRTGDGARTHTHKLTIGREVRDRVTEGQRARELALWKWRRHSLYTLSRSSRTAKASGMFLSVLRMLNDS